MGRCEAAVSNFISSFFLPHHHHVNDRWPPDNDSSAITPPQGYNPVALFQGKGSSAMPDCRLRREERFMRRRENSTHTGRAEA